MVGKLLEPGNSMDNNGMTMQAHETQVVSACWHELYIQ